MESTEVVRASSVLLVNPEETHTYPYFAHQQLDREQFPGALGLAISHPNYARTTSGGTINTKRKRGQQASEGSSGEDEDITQDQQDKGTTTRRRISTTTAVAPVPKKLRIAGGRPATSKRVTADMDSDDELIVRMKNAKYLEKDIAQCLVDEGRIAYNPKTIGTRWARMKRAMQQRQDELLDAGATDWHAGDDDALVKAISKADEDVRRAQEDAASKKWRLVADHLKAIKPVVNFSQNACRARWEDLLVGKAKPTPESILNPDETTRARIQARTDRQKLIDEDRTRFGQASANLEKNGWTSRMTKYF